MGSSSRPIDSRTSSTPFVSTTIYSAGPGTLAWRRRRQRSRSVVSRSRKVTSHRGSGTTRRHLVHVSYDPDTVSSVASRREDASERIGSCHRRSGIRIDRLARRSRAGRGSASYGDVQRSSNPVRNPAHRGRDDRFPGSAESISDLFCGLIFGRPCGSRTAAIRRSQSRCSRRINSRSSARVTSSSAR